MEMHVMAFSTPIHPDWRWRIVNAEGQTIEESSEMFPTIAAAVREGERRLKEMCANDTSIVIANHLNSTARLRRRRASVNIERSGARKATGVTAATTHDE